MLDVQIIQGDARAIPLADATVQCVVTSPPYWGLRKYAGAQDLVWDGDPACEHEFKAAAAAAAITGGLNGAIAYEKNRFVEGHAAQECRLCGAWRGAYGLEPTIEMYVEHTLLILREIRRVLRTDGVVFWNVGDSYAASKGYSGDLKPSDLQSSNRGSLRGRNTRPPNRNGMSGLKPKDLCLIPERVAIAAQADGWWIRSMIIWAKPNPMPESVTDRPTDAYEHILMLTKSERYFWDADAVREEASDPGRTNWRNHIRSMNNGEGLPPGASPHTLAREDYRGIGRNLRNVWAFPTQPYKGAHFATFPEEIPRRCILAATSARGACRQCGAPWERITRPRSTYAAKLGRSLGNGDAKELAEGKARGFGEPRVCAEYQTIGWHPTCECRGQRGQTRPCLVLDPFGGSGTTARVAVELNRRAVSLDLAYHDHAEARTRRVQRRLIPT